jgi:hypothetical protein
MNALEKFSSKIIFSQRPIVPPLAKRVFHRLTPYASAFLNEPIGQVFIADEEIRTFLCVNEIYSILSPGFLGESTLEVRLRDSDGRVIAGTEMTIPAHGSTAIDVDELLAHSKAKCTIGLATVVLRPRTHSATDESLLKRLGKTSSNFFTYYLGRHSEAMAIIHPQAALNQASTPELERASWMSSQSITVAGLESFRVYQANHAPNPTRVTYMIFDMTSGAILAEQVLPIAARSAAMAEFRADTLRTSSPVVWLRVLPLPTPNGKPLMMRRYAGERFSMSHG